MKLLAALLVFSPIWENPIYFRQPIDQRPFLIRLVCSIGLAFEVGAEKARLRVDRKGAELSGNATDKDSLTVQSLIPNGGAVTVKFGTDY